MQSFKDSNSLWEQKIFCCKTRGVLAEDGTLKIFLSWYFPKRMPFFSVNDEKLWVLWAEDSLQNASFFRNKGKVWFHLRRWGVLPEFLNSLFENQNSKEESFMKEIRRNSLQITKVDWKIIFNNVRLLENRSFIGKFARKSSDKSSNWINKN